LVSDLGIMRYQGLTYHSLHLASLSMLLLCSILILKLKNKLSSSEFFIMFIPIFIFGYLTISRAFIITTMISLIIFFIFYIIKYKKKSLPLLWSLVMVIFLVGILFLDVTRTYFIRLENVYDLKSYIPNNPSKDWLQEFLGGEIPLTRIDLAKIYLYDWASSLETILCGRGVSKPWIIPGLNAHNIILQRLWEHGIIGCVFYITIFITLINWKKIKEYKKYLPILILVIPFVLFLMVEVIHFEYTGLALTFVVFGWINKTGDEKKEKLSKEKDVKIIEKETGKSDYEQLKKLKLSIIIPVYNGENFIKKFIDKVLRINLNKEIIVVNDGSTDNSLELLKTYKENIILIDVKENKGVSHARNLGLEKATGDYVCFMDVDDDFELEMHNKILTKMLNENADVGMCNFDMLDVNGRLIKVGKPLNFNGLTQFEVIRLYLINKLYHVIWTSIYKKDIICDIKFEEKTRLGEDTLYQLQVLLKARKTCFLDDILYHYYDNLSSTSHLLASPENVIGHIKIIDNLTNEEKVLLVNNFADEFNCFKLHNLINCVNLVARWRKFNKNKTKEVKEFLQTIINKSFYKKIKKNKKIAWYVKFEFLLLKSFGVTIFLFVFPFLDFLRKILFHFERCLK